VVGQEHERARAEEAVHAPRRGGHDERARAESGRRADRHHHVAGVMSLVRVVPPLEDDDVVPRERPATSRPRWPATVGGENPGISP
jgi:hypothetical protein